jgi:DNA processing protein
VSACPECLRRGWLLGALNGRLEYAGRDPGRLVDLLALSDEQLIRAVGGGESARLLERYAHFDLESKPQLEDVERVCRHDPGFPVALRQGRGAPRLLHLAGGRERLRELLRAPAVAIVGARNASDYGLEVAHGLARGLAASGITIVSGLAEGIAAAAHAGALEVAGPTLTVTAGGVDVGYPTVWRALRRRLREDGCALSELECGERPRSWCHTACARVVVALASLVIVVEARQRPGELLHAHFARAGGKPLAAVPGRVTSPLAQAPHALLGEGALLVRGAQDALDALYGVGLRRAPAECSVGEPPAESSVGEPRLQAVLEQIAAGRDTLSKLIAAGAAEQETLLALATLELSGALVRGDAGRYVPRL